MAVVLTSQNYLFFLVMGSFIFRCMVALQSVTGNFVVSTLMAFRGNDTIGGHFLTKTPEKQQKERYALCHSSSLNSNDTGLLKSTRTGNIMLTHFGLVSNADISLR